VHVISVLFDDRYGGAPKRVVEVARGLRERGVWTTVCLPAGGGNVEDLAREAGVDVVRLDFERIPPPRDGRRVLRWVVRLPGDIRRFVGLFRRERPDVAHVNGAFFLAPAIAAKLARVPLVWHINDTVLPRRVAPLFGALVRLMADEIVVAAKAVAKHYGVAAAAHEVIHPPVNSEYLSITRRARGEKQRVGLIANWNPLKGVEHFVRAAALVRESFEGELEIVFVGARLESHAEYARSIDALISELDLRPVVRERGFVPSVAGVLAELDVLVMSSISEASSMPVLEAMAAGVPVVAADVGGVREVVCGDLAYPSGMVVPPAEPEAMAAAILVLLRHPGEAEQMGENGRLRVRKNFLLDACVGQHLEVYEAAAGSRERGEPCRFTDE
jgi:glycosyltransferase involved in cell wall biosynthesis